MNILVDRHHAGLLYSLQLLFEDRLGGTVYVPIGHEWWNEEYWRFGQVFGDDRLAQQYLVMHDGQYEPGLSGYYTCADVEFPEREIRCVTLDQFHEMEWAFTLASVQENQHGFNRLAAEAEAKSIYQIGNRGQQVDWDLDFVALVSAEASIPDGRGVLYHQEYEKDTVFRYRPPTARHSIASFVNCFDRINPQWEYFLAAESEGDEFEWYVHGHDGRSGLVQPTTSVAEAMASYGWAWHDKPQGDGFGHIIHYWASVGRPLIGHASYYDGLFAGPLWEDGVTCVTLDGREPDQVVDLVRRITADPPRHEAMCREIRSRVDALVDFDAEESAIRALLGL